MQNDTMDLGALFPRTFNQQVVAHRIESLKYKHMIRRKSNF